jgi:hypothetical protein
MWLLHRLYALVSLRMETRVYNWLGVCKLLRAALKRSMLRLLPCWDIWWWRNVYTRCWVRIRRHIRLHSMSCQRWWNIRRMLLVRINNNGSRLPTRRRTRVCARLSRPVYRAGPSALRRWEIRCLRCEVCMLLRLLGPALRVLLLLLLLLNCRCEAVGFRWRWRRLLLLLRIWIMLRPGHRPIYPRIVPSRRLLWLWIPWVRRMSWRWRSPLTVCVRSGRLVSLMSYAAVSVSPCISSLSDIFTSIAWRWWRYWGRALLPREARRASWRLPVVLHRDSSSLSSTRLFQVSRRSELRIRRKRVFGMLAELPAYINGFSLEVQHVKETDHDGSEKDRINIGA